MSDQSKKNYHIIPGIKMGIVTPERLEAIAQVTRKYAIPMLKITSAQRIAFIGMDQEVADQVWRDLGETNGPKKPVGLHYVQACPGIKNCKYGCQDSIALGETIQHRFMGLALPAKTKIGISGCSMNCTESYIRDLGIFGKKKGWTLVFGGNGGGNPRIGDIIAENLSDDEVLVLAQRCLQFYGDNAKKKERTARFMERTGLDVFKNNVLSNNDEIKIKM